MPKEFRRGEGESRSIPAPHCAGHLADDNRLFRENSANRIAGRAVVARGRPSGNVTGSNLSRGGRELGPGALERNVPLLNPLFPSDFAHWPVMDTEIDGHVTHTTGIVDRATFKRTRNPWAETAVLELFPSRTETLSFESI